MAIRILAALMLVLAGCGQGLKVRPTRTITLTKLAWLPVDPAYTEQIELPPFPEEPVTNQKLNDYRRALELLIDRVNADREAIEAATKNN